MLLGIGPGAQAVVVAQPLPAGRIELADGLLVSLGIKDGEVNQVTADRGGIPGSGSNSNTSHSRLEVLGRCLCDGEGGFVVGMDVELTVDGRGSFVEAKTQ